MHERKRGIYARTNGALRRVLWTCAVVLVALLAGLFYAKTRVHDVIRDEVQRRFAEHYGALQVSVRSARLIEGRGIEIHGLSLTRPSDGVRLVYVDEIFNTCSVTMEQLLAGERPPVEHVLVRGLKLRAERQEDGTWSLQQLWPLPRFGYGATPATIKDAVVEVVDGTRPERPPLVLRDLSAEITPQRLAGAEQEWPAGAERGPAQPRGASPAAPATPEGLKISLKLAGDHLGAVDLTARYDPRDGRWQTNGQVTGLRLSPATYDLLPTAFRHRMEIVAALSGTVDFQFRLAGMGTTMPPNEFLLSGKLHDGQVVDARIPYRLHDLSAMIYCDRERLKIDNLVARSGKAELQASLERQGWAGESPLALRVTARDLTLDQTLADVLPESFQAHWRRYSPAGRVNADVTLGFDGQAWQPEVAVECLDVSFAYYKFPYRLEGTRGKVQLKDGRLTLDVTASASGQPVTIHGELRDPLGVPYGAVDVACRGPLPLDEKLMAAVIDPKAQDMVRALNPAGMLAIEGRFERRRPQDPAFEKRVQINVHNGTVRYRHFPYPIGMIRGTLRWDESGWTFHDLAGHNDSGYVQCAGSWTPVPAGGGVLALNITGTDIPLQDELRDALTPAVRRVWTDLRPRGCIDQVKVIVNYASADRRLSLDVAAQNWKRQRSDEARSVTIHPAWFPYRFDEVTGTVRYRDGQVDLRDLVAVHNNTEVRASGQCTFDAAGRWRVALDELTADRVRADRDLLAAMPAGLGRALGKLNLDGDLGVQGRLTVEGVAGTEQPPTVGWDLTVDMDNGSLHCGFPLQHVHGDVRLTGAADGTRVVSRGELQIDSLTYKDVQATQIRGPMLVTDSHLLLGAAADAERRDGPPRMLTGKAFGGQCALEARVVLDGDTPFQLQCRLERADVAQFAREVSGHSHDITGKMNSVVTLAGNGQGPSSWRGRGAVRLYDADIYEVPVMFALLKLLSIRRPDRTGFTSSEIDFHVEGEHLYFNRIHFHGDAISLRGSGEMDLDRRINMRFYTLVGRTDMTLPVVRTLLSQASQQLLLIHANGTLDDPRLTREPLPLIRETLEQVFPEVANREPFRNLPQSNPLPPLRDRLLLRR